VTDYPEEQWLLLSGLQHFRFCRRQWALIHIEQQWAENERTVDGTLMHQRAHDRDRRRFGSRRPPWHVRLFRPSHLPACDVVEFHPDPSGPIGSGRPGRPSREYKREAPKPHDADELQLCAQAMCLEEMLCTAVPDGVLYYGETRRRVPVSFSEPLRAEVRACLTEMHDLFRRGHTPKVKPARPAAPAP
jgi:CRISPR-associated exonuclease Cas4